MMDLRFKQAVCLEREGIALRARGDLLGAAATFTRMRDLLAERAVDMPEDPLAMAHVASATRRIADARSTMGEHTEALRLGEEAFEICEARCGGDPAYSEPERDLSLCCDLMGDVLRNMGRPEKAIPHLERGVELVRWLASLPSEDEDLKQSDLGATLERLAWALGDAGRLDDALLIQREQILLARGVAERDTSGGNRRKFLASSLSSTGSVLRRLGQMGEARDVLREALAQYDRAFKGREQGTFDLHHRAVAHRRLGKVCAAMGDLDAARRHLTVSVELGKDITDAAPDALHCQWGVQSALSELALVLQREGHEVAARSAAREAAALESRLTTG